MVGDAQEDVARHYAVLQALRSSPGGDPLAAHAPTATINNPRWFSELDGHPIALPERKRFQVSLVASIAAQGRAAAAGAQPVAVLLAGPPGAGKSTGLNDVFERNDVPVTSGLKRSDFVVVDADAIKGLLLDAARADGSLEAEIKPPMVRDLETGGERFSALDFSSLVHEESSMIAKMIRDETISQRKNLLLDQVCLSMVKTAELVDRLDAAGYSVRVVEMHATREFSLESTFGRYVAAAACGQDARRVPTEVVESVFNADGTSKPRQAVEALLTARPSKVTEYRRYDARELGKPPVLVESGTRTLDGDMVRRSLGSLGQKRAKPQHRMMAKADVLDAQRARAQRLVKDAARSRSETRRRPTR